MMTHHLDIESLFGGLNVMEFWNVLVFTINGNLNSNSPEDSENLLKRHFVWYLSDIY